MSNTEEATQPAVGQIIPGPGCWTVKSTNRDTSYVVRLDPPRCTCPHNRFRREVCKHLKAVQAMAPARPVSWIGWERQDKASAWRAVAFGDSWDSVTRATLA